MKIELKDQVQCQKKPVQSKIKSWKVGEGVAYD